MTTKTGDRRGWTPMDALRPNGPGTESNRARAARGGPMGGDVLSVPTSCVAPCTVTPVTTIPGGSVGGRGLTFDGAGVLYGQASDQAVIYRIPVDGSVPTSYATDPAFAFPYGFSTGPDGALYSADYSASRTFRITAAPFVPTVTVPTLSEWAMILFGLGLAGSAAVIVQRRRQYA